MKKQVKSAILFMLLVYAAVPLSPMGSSDDSTYKQQLIEAFDRAVRSISTGEWDTEEGKRQLALVRSEHGRIYDDISGKLDSLLNQMAEGTITADEAIREVENLSLTANQQEENNSYGSHSEDAGSYPAQGSKSDSDRGSDNSGSGKQR